MKVRAFKGTEVVSTDDGDFTLHIDMAVVDAIEDEFDERFDLVMQKFSDVRIGKLTRLVRLLLAHNHPGLSLDDVGALVMSYGEKFGKGIERLFEKAGQAVEGEPGENPPKPRRGTRKPS